MKWTLKEVIQAVNNYPSLLANIKIGKEINTYQFIKYYDGFFEIQSKMGGQIYTFPENEIMEYMNGPFGSYLNI